MLSHVCLVLQLVPMMQLSFTFTVHKTRLPTRLRFGDIAIVLKVIVFQTLTEETTPVSRKVGLNKCMCALNSVMYGFYFFSHVTKVVLLQ